MTPEEKKEAKRLYDIEYRKRNKERIAEQKREWVRNNPDKVKASKIRNKECIKNCDKKYAKANKDKLNKKKLEWAKNNPEKVKEAKRKYTQANRDKINTYIRKQYSTSPLFKLKSSIRGNILSSLKRKGYIKNSKTEEILGCTFEEFKRHIESQWECWMTWDNYGLYNGELNYGWDVDHIKPISSAINENEVVEFNHFTNLQPLCSKINRDIKRDLII